MTKELQDRAWACLPKEVREEIKGLFNKADNTNNFAAMGICLKIFGKHNLTSDTEPEEMLMVKRNFVIIQYEEANNREKQNVKNGAIEWACQYHGMQMAMEILFGDKCLPDKPIPSDSTELKDTGFGGISLTPPAYKLDAKPDKELINEAKQIAKEIV